MKVLYIALFAAVFAEPQISTHRSWKVLESNFNQTVLDLGNSLQLILPNGKSVIETKDHFSYLEKDPNLFKEDLRTWKASANCNGAFARWEHDHLWGQYKAAVDASMTWWTPCFEVTGYINSVRICVKFGCTNCNYAGAFQSLSTELWGKSQENKCSLNQGDNLADRQGCDCFLSYSWGSDCKEKAGTTQYYTSGTCTRY